MQPTDRGQCVARQGKGSFEGNRPVKDPLARIGNPQSNACLSPIVYTCARMDGVLETHL